MHVSELESFVSTMPNYLPGGYSSEDSDDSDGGMMMSYTRDYVDPVSAPPTKGRVHACLGSGS